MCNCGGIMHAKSHSRSLTDKPPFLCFRACFYYYFQCGIMTMFWQWTRARVYWTKSTTNGEMAWFAYIGEDEGVKRIKTLPQFVKPQHSIPIANYGSILLTLDTQHVNYICDTSSVFKVTPYGIV